jgi:hypothetical protein
MTRKMRSCPRNCSPPYAGRDARTTCAAKERPRRQTNPQRRRYTMLCRPGRTARTPPVGTRIRGSGGSRTQERSVPRRSRQIPRIDVAARPIRISPRRNRCSGVRPGPPYVVRPVLLGKARRHGSSTPEYSSPQVSTARGPANFSGVFFGQERTCRVGYCPP